MKPNNLLTSTFEKKWTSYALAGGAILIAPAAKASLITTTPTPNISLYSDDATVDSATLDVDGDGRADFEFSVSAPSDTSRYAMVQGLYAGASVYTDAALGPYSGGPYVSLVGYGSPTIPTQVLTSSGTFLEDKYALVDVDEGGPIYGYKIKGNWNPNATSEGVFRSMAFQFLDVNDIPHMGWAEVSAHLGSADLQVNAAEYESTAIVPEPSSIALMLLGAAGIAALKRRRHTAQ